MNHRIAFMIAGIVAIAIVAFIGLQMRDQTPTSSSVPLNAAEYQRFAETCEKDRTSLKAFTASVAASGGSYERSGSDLQHLEQGLVKVTAGMTSGEVEKLAGPPNYVSAVWYQGETLLCEWTYVYAGKSANNAFTAAKQNVIGLNGDGRVTIPPSGPWSTINR